MKIFGGGGITGGPAGRQKKRNLRGNSSKEAKERTKSERDAWGALANSRDN